jgi:hypothetical protein
MAELFARGPPEKRLFREIALTPGDISLTIARPRRRAPPRVAITPAPS